MQKTLTEEEREYIRGIMNTPFVCYTDTKGNRHKCSLVANEKDGFLSLGKEIRYSIVQDSPEIEYTDYVFEVPMISIKPNIIGFISKGIKWEGDNSINVKGFKYLKDYSNIEGENLQVFIREEYDGRVEFRASPPIKTNKKHIKTVNKILTKKDKRHRQ